jgi:hypothetical protein
LKPGPISDKIRILLIIHPRSKQQQYRRNNNNKPRLTPPTLNAPHTPTYHHDGEEGGKRKKGERG